MSDFKLVSPFKPAGDQPQAIKKLVTGLKKDFKIQTLLGVTGSGKSLDYDESIFIRERNGFIKKISIGEFVDLNFTNPSFDGDSMFEDISGPFIKSFNSRTGKQEEKKIKQISKHKEEFVYQLNLDDGSSVSVTKDHNCFKFKNGFFELLPTDSLKEGDYLPLPTNFVQPLEPIEVVDLNVLSNKLDVSNLINNYSISYPTLKNYCKSSGFVEKSWEIKNSTSSRGLFENEFNSFIDYFSIPYGDAMMASTFITKKRGKLPMSVPLTKDFLSFMGLYVSEGCLTDRAVIITNSEKHLQEQVLSFACRYDLGTYIRNDIEVVINSSILSRFFLKFGKRAENKIIPDFIYNLSNFDLGVFLQSVFDGDGWVESNGAVCLSSASNKLVFDLKNLLLRFGITSRIITKKTTHQDAHIISIYGQDNLKKYFENIGFSINYKQDLLNSILGKLSNTNVDVYPNSSTLLKSARLKLGLDQKDVAKICGCERSYVSMFESGIRQPSKKIIQPFLNYISKNSDLILPDVQKFNLRKIVSITKKHSKTGFVYDLAIEDNETFMAGNGLIYVHNTFTMAGVIEKYNRPTIVLAHNKTLAFQLFNELKEFFPENKVEFFISFYDYYQPESYLPSSDTYIEKDAQINPKIEQMRVKATTSLLTRNDTIVVASVSAIYGIGDPTSYANAAFEIRTGLQISRRDLIIKLLKMQYTRNDVELVPGRFRVKGSVIDLVPAYQDNYIRIIMRGDRIVGIHELSNPDLLKVEEHEELVIFPGKHFVMGEDVLDRGIEEINHDLEEWFPKLEEKNKLFAYRLKQKVKYDMEMLKEMGYCNGIENYSRYFDGRKEGMRPYCLLDFFPDDFLMVIDESHQSIPQLNAMYKGDRSRKETLVEYGFRLPSALDNRPLKFEEFKGFMNHVVCVSATPAEYELERSSQVVEQIVRPTGLVDPEIEVRKSEGQMTHLLGEIKKAVEKNQRVLLTTITKRLAEDLTEYFANKGVKTRYLHSEIDSLERIEIIRQLRLGKFDVLVGINLLREGLDIPEVGLVAILDADKQGFLRNDKSLIQLIGRAARNVDARVIMYADVITDAIDKTIKETNRRREIQVNYNKKHNITPKTIIKAVSEDEVVKLRDEKSLPTTELPALIIQLEADMKLASEELDFERAIKIRNRIQDLQKKLK